MSAAVPEPTAVSRTRDLEFRLRAKHHPLKSSVWDRKVGQ